MKKRVLRQCVHLREHLFGRERTIKQQNETTQKQTQKIKTNKKNKDTERSKER